MNNELNSPNSDNHLSEMVAKIAEAQARLAESAQSTNISAFNNSYDYLSKLGLGNQDHISALAGKMNFCIPNERLSETALRLNESLTGLSKIFESPNIVGMAPVYSNAFAFSGKMNFSIPDECLPKAALYLNESLLGFSRMPESFNASGIASIYSDAHASALAAMESMVLPAMKAAEIISKISNDHARLLKTIDSINLPTMDTPTFDSGDLKSITPVPQRHKKSKGETNRVGKQSKRKKHNTEVIAEVLGEGELDGFNPTVEMDGKKFRTHTKHSAKLLQRLLDDPMGKHLN